MRRLALLAACASLSVLLATGGVSAQTAGAAPGVPTSLSATAVGGSLTVTWSAPTDDGGATITSYDLQYGEGDGTDLANATWTVLDDVWTSGSLSYVVSGLKESTGVRRAGASRQQRLEDGAWSVSRRPDDRRPRQHARHGDADRPGRRRSRNDRYLRQTRTTSPLPSTPRPARPMSGCTPLAILTRTAVSTTRAGGRWPRITTASIPMASRISR